MATNETDDIQKLRPEKSCFPSCFGFSRDVSGHKRPGGRDHRVSGREKRLRLSWLRFRRRKSGRRTVPVDVAISDKLTCEIEEEVRDICESETAERCPAVVAPVPKQSAAEKDRKAKIGKGGVPLSEGDNNFRPESRKDVDDSASAKTDHSRPGSPPADPVGGDARCSSSVPNHRELARVPGLTCWCSIAGNVNSMAGMSVLAVALGIMTVWGRVCAILCTAAWFYFLPLLRTKTSSEEVAWNRAQVSTLDVDSEQYKKKVILAGLLERGHKSPAVTL